MARKRRSSGSRTSAPGTVASTSGGAASFKTKTTYVQLSAPSTTSITGLGGYTYVSYRYEDPFRRNAPGLILFPEFPGGDLDGINGGGTTIQGQGVLDNWVGDMIQLMHSMAASQGFNITNYNSTGTIEASWETLILNYMDIYRSLMGLKALMMLSGFNRPCSAIARVLQSNVIEIDTRVARLSSFCMPQNLVTELNKTCGVWTTGDPGTPPLAVLPTVATGLGNDLTVAANVTTLLAALDTKFGLIDAIAAQDLANITRVLAQLYKRPPSIDVIPFHDNADQDYRMHFSRAIVHAQAAVVDTCPCLNGLPSNPLVPMLIYGDPTQLDYHWTTLFRHPVAYSDTNVATAATTVFGVFDADKGVVGTHGTQVVYYESDGTYRDESVSTFLDAAAGVITMAESVIRDFPWAMQAVLARPAAGQLTDDLSALGGWAPYYLSFSDIANNTIRLYERIWIDGVVPRTVR